MASSAALVLPPRREPGARLVVAGLGLFTLAAAAFIVGEALLGVICLVVGAPLTALGFRAARTAARQSEAHRCPACGTVVFEGHGRKCPSCGHLQ